MNTAKYHRVVLKLSGESLAGDQGFGINPEVVEDIAKQIRIVRQQGIDVAVVVGGGNIWRGLAGSAKGMDRATADYMGMMATVFGAGTGNPYFSTDTTAALRAAEIEADVILMAKKGTDGIYDCDPNKNPDAKKFDSLTYIDILNKGLAVMDTTATSLCMDNDIPLVVFNIDEHENIVKAAVGEKIGTTVGGKEA